MNISSTTKKQTHIIVRKVRFSEPTDHGTSSVQELATSACLSSIKQRQCTRSEKERLIQPSEYAEYYERNRINTLEKEHLYKRRQAIVEHPYGTIKRQWGFSYILTKKGIGRAGSDVGFMLIAYNLRRIGNILTMNLLKEYLRILVSMFLTVFGLLRGKLLISEEFIFTSVILTLRNRLWLKRA